MDRHIRGIDHLLVGVRGLDEAATAWRRLGFTLTPLGRHVGWTTANLCVMLEQGYIELLGVLDPSGVRHDIAAFLERGEGGMGVALATDDAAATGEAWRRSRFAIAGPDALARRIDEAGTTTELRFANVTPEVPEFGGFVLFACFHETPERVRRPDWLAHANGARRLRSCTLLADPPEATASALARLLGESAAVNTDHVTTFHLGDQSIVVAPVEDVRLFHPEIAEAEENPAPRLVAAEIEVDDLADTARLLEANAVAVRRTAGGLAVAPADACGIAIEFVAPASAADRRR